MARQWAQLLLLVIAGAFEGGAIQVRATALLFMSVLPIGKQAGHFDVPVILENDQALERSLSWGHLFRDLPTRAVR